MSEETDVCIKKKRKKKDAVCIYGTRDKVARGRKAGPGWP
jgi:hypothetical protein